MAPTPPAPAPDAMPAPPAAPPAPVPAPPAAPPAPVPGPPAAVPGTAPAPPVSAPASLTAPPASVPGPDHAPPAPTPPGTTPVPPVSSPPGTTPAPPAPTPPAAPVSPESPHSAPLSSVPLGEPVSAGAGVPVGTPSAPPAPSAAFSGRFGGSRDSDPHGTPSCGQPGPWAPAPPGAEGGTTAPPQPASVPAPAATPAAETTDPVSEGEAGAPGEAVDPWRTYDPWAKAAAGRAFQQNGAAVESTGQRRRRVRRALVGGAVALALVSGVGGGIVGAYLERNGGLGDIVLPQASAEPAGRDPDSVAGISARALPSVVTLHVAGSKESGTGTGFVLDDRGHILTNNHVVEPAGSSGRIAVTFNSGDTAKATVVGRDSGYDLAVVKVTGVRGMKPLPLGNSDNVRVGDPVVAIGAPFDLAGTVTSGIISAKERPITAGAQRAGSDVSYVDALQTDAPINPGNSGGPLLDSRARVIGINSAIRSADGGADAETGQSGSIGLGFAIPVNQAKRVAEELINTGRATHPVIGVTLDMNYGGDGARVAAHGNEGDPAVTEDGPGARAGIEPGDVITEVDGRAVHTGEELIVKTRAHRPGDHLELTVVRAGKERTVTLVLGSSHGG
ncbi:S1C family serine protease [Streptomyces sp. NPDC101249]|uniref:S1C family serine protease n=1 Tax=Streptomyces sp. NPDC101249 TaxID=3366140 RepID=UPI00381709F6